MEDENSQRTYLGILKEAVEKDSDRDGGFNAYLDNAKAATFTQRYLKEGLFSDMAGALGAMHKQVVEAAKPNLIGREMIWVVNTKDPATRFFKQKLSVAYVVGETEPTEVPERMETQDVECKTEIACKMEFSKSYIEDAPFNVLQRAVEEGSRAVAKLETDKIIALYKGIAAGNLATGAEIATNEGANFAWADVAKLWNAVEKEDFGPNVLCINVRELEGVFSQNQFIQSLYYAPEDVIRRGVFDAPALGMRIIASTLIPSLDATHNYKFAIDTKSAAVLLVRRDILAEPFENPGKLRSGVIISERIGLGVLRSKAVARGV